jgi:hypothetical protein
MSSSHSPSRTSGSSIDARGLQETPNATPAQDNDPSPSSGSIRSFTLGPENIDAVQSIAPTPPQGVTIEDEHEMTTLSVPANSSLEIYPDTLILDKAATVESKAIDLDISSDQTAIAPELTKEKPKIAFGKGLRGNWIKFYPHLLAIAVTLAVVQLSFRNVYWMDLKPPNHRITPGLTQGGALNFLQLAAKLHEYVLLSP